MTARELLEARTLVVAAQRSSSTVAQIDHGLKVADAVLGLLDEVGTTVQSRMPVVRDDRPELPIEADRRRDLESDLELLDAGVTRDSGIVSPELEPLREVGGRDWWRRQRNTLVALRAERTSPDLDPSTWPRAYRYTGGKFRALFEGRYLEPGEVVMLQAAQARGWADRFRPADEPVEGQDADASAPAVAARKAS